MIPTSRGQNFGISTNDDEIDMPVVGNASDPHSERLKVGIEADVDAANEDEVRAARLAYYANTSYFDAKVGEVVKALEESGQLDNTIVIVTSDHGDLLGERGLWYKMSFLGAFSPRADDHGGAWRSTGNV